MADPAAGGVVYPINACKHHRVSLTRCVDVYIRMRLYMHIYKGYVYAYIYIKGICVYLYLCRERGAAPWPSCALVALCLCKDRTTIWKAKNGSVRNRT